MVSDADKQKFLDKLEDLPIPSVVCRHVGISKASIYRWREEDPDFKKRYERALKRGRETIVDHAESKLLKLVDKEVLGAIKMVLEANSRRYYKPRKPMSAPREAAPITGFTIKVQKDDITIEEYERQKEETYQKNQELKRRRMGEELDPDEDTLPSL